jgi:hypothetical protein
MRKIIATAFVAAFAASMMPMSADAAKAPAKSKMGCVVGKEKWNAVDGKCMSAKPVAKAKPAAKAVAKKA